MRKTATLAFFLLLLSSVSTEAKTGQYLQKCWETLGPKKGQYFTADYKQSSHSFYHSFQPWQLYGSKSRGIIMINGGYWAKVDTVGSKRIGFSKTQYNGKDLLYMGYGDTALTDVTQKDVEDELFETMRYSPVMMLGYFKEHEREATESDGGDEIEYMLTVYKKIVRLYMGKTDAVIHKITTAEPDELYGDLRTDYIYSGYANAGKNYLPTIVTIGKINGRVNDTVTLSNTAIAGNITPLLARPANYELKVEKAETTTGVPVEKYNDHIHFVKLSRGEESSHSMIVEFKDFLLVAEAPLNSENGEAIIREAKKIAPNKPIKYFAFGHWHNWYLGGIRPFVHKGAKILCESLDKEYTSFITNAPRTLQPDSLQLQPKPLMTQEFTDSITISDGSYEMKIYKLGKYCEHARDFQVYYFPQEKMLFEDELVRIPIEGEPRKAGEGQKGLYNAIKAYNLDVKTLRQSWPVGIYGMKNAFSFEELEKTVNMP
jgi:hypothetical protein